MGNKDKKVATAITQSAYDEWSYWAEKSGMSLAAFIRKAVDTYCSFLRSKSNKK